MSGGWYIFLFLFILGVVMQGVTTFNIWAPKYPNAQFTMDQSTIVSTQEAVSDSPMGIFVIYVWVMTFIKIIGSGILAVISVGLLLYGLGWPIGLIGAALIQIIQLPANLVIFMWLFELITGRSVG